MLRRNRCAVIDRNALRAALASTPPESVLDVLTDLLDACGEHARELKMPASEFIEHAVEAWCEATDHRTIDVEVEQDDTGYSTVVVMEAKWRGN